ncbi:polyphosphate kinase [Balneicella halophila]|uniref:Polyphosphate kinase n=1 Tax=Balneicella halophila TaxID=1537566 RepID=A0A7L4UN52_BALHA|nr:polyphosphate kinase 1 [Balneicella halophila]PVX49986.1 polyphosphate kinase [Balneicella halophila]
MPTNTYRFFNRELSWLSFNKRVLDEAKSEELPLYERINFLAIYSNNLEEFFSVRVASYKKLQRLSEDIGNGDTKPGKILNEIRKTVNSHLQEFNQIFDDVIEKLKSNNIYLVRDFKKLDENQKSYITELFHDALIPHTHPMLLLKDRVNPFLQNNVPYYLLRLYKKKSKASKPQPRYAIVRIPSHHFDRFIEIPQRDGRHFIMFLDDIVRYNLSSLFPGYTIDKAHTFMVTRDADFEVEDELDGDIIDNIEKNVLRREVGEYSRFSYDHNMPARMVEVLKDNFKLIYTDMLEAGKYLKLNDLFSFPNPFYPEMEREKFHHLNVKELDEANTILKALKKKEYLLHFPYHSYHYVIRMLNEAAIDPKVEKIMVTQYRVAKNSAVVEALIGAARNGKEVTVFVEVKARFDETANLHFAKEMQHAGIKIIYSIPGIKVHAKVALVLRKGDSTNYAFLSTGNFNEKTATLYSDIGYFTKKPEIITDLVNLFDYLENQNTSPRFKHLFIGQFNLYKNIIKLIEREIKNKKDGKKAHMILKMNGLQEKNVIEKLYEASLAGVKVDLIVRGICCLVPNQKYSKNIKIIRIVDRFLEHARVFYFYNDGDEEFYLSSADLMNRNMHRRIESAFPIVDEPLKKQIKDFLDIQLADNLSACLVNEKLENVRIEREPNTPAIRAQAEMCDYVQGLENKN